MKKVLVVLAALFAVPAFAQVNLYGGAVNAGSVGASRATTQGGSAAAFAGISGTQSTAGAFQGGVAGGAVGPSGVVTYQAGGSGTNGTSTSGALGLAGAGSTYGSGAGNVSGATGAFRTIGIGF